DISTTLTSPGKLALACSNWSAFTPTVTGSKRDITLATSEKALCAGFAPLLHVSVLVGQSIQVLLWGSNSPGMRNPSVLGVFCIVLVTSIPPRILLLTSFLLVSY